MPRPRKSIEALKLSNTYRPHRHDRRRDVPAAGDLTTHPPPDHLTEPEQAVWHEVCTVAPPKLLRDADKFLLEAFVTAVAAHRGARQAASLGILVKSSSGAVLNPALGEMRRQARLIAEIAGKFGLTPASRLNLLDNTPKEPEDATSPGFARMFGGLKMIKGDRAA
jgi:P27 family predicted phage terminase small subunit